MKIEDYAINMIDNLPIEEAIKVVSYYDSRPLTDETLEELGFESNLYNMGKYSKLKYLGSDGVKLVVDYRNVGKYCKTVGSVKMLIEALKRDEWNEIL